MNRRKQVLKIGTKSYNRNTPDRENSKNGSGLGLLGSYGHDIDGGYSHHDDDDSDNEKKLPQSTLDSKVADFLKEIDDLDAALPTANTKSKKKEKTVIKTENTSQFSANEFISWGPWQQCVDENTQHPYYWNTTTNEVTWTVPEEIAIQYEQIAQGSQVTSSTSAEKKGKAEKTETYLKEVSKIIKKSDKKKEKKPLSDEAVSTRNPMASKSDKKTKNIDNQSETDPTLKESSVLSEIQKSSTNVDTDEIPVKRKKVSSMRDEKVTESSSVDQNVKCDDDDKAKEVSSLKDETKSVDSPLPIEKPDDEPKPDLAKSEVEDNFKTLKDKLECFDTRKDSISLLHQLYIETEIRLSDWQAGALSEEYVKKRIEEVNERLTNYEKTIMPTGWLCHWDSRYHRYYYTNNFGRTQWDFPSAAEESTAKTTESTPTASTTTESETGSSTPTSVSNSTNTSASTSEKAPAADSNDKTGSLSAPSFPPNVNYGSFNVPNYYWNMANYGMQYRGQFTPSGYNSPRSGDQPPPPPGEESAPLPPASEEPVPPPPPPEEEEEGEQSPPPPPPPEPSVATEEAEVESDGIEMEISDVEEDSLMEPSIKDLTSISMSLEMQPIAELKGAPVEYAALTPPTNTPEPVLSTSFNPSLTTEKNKKTKKTKKDKGPVKKPPKQMFGMVAKWQKAKQEMQEEEERLIMEREQELDQENDTRLRIEKWKMEQLQSGKAALNANFQPVGDDWKKRVKMRKKVT